ncbi:MAG: hypothetical protein RLZZ59_156 [Pseudomonadota bacterium]|jgi:multicomponent Na+:H+ antiporter subunit B
MRFEFSLELLFVVSIACIFLLYKILFEKELRSAIIWFGVLSLSCCILYLVMDAPDVAMTEAALGACITTIVMLKISNISSDTSSDNAFLKSLVAIVSAILFAVALIYAGSEMVGYGSVDSPVHSGVNSYYTQNTYKEIGIESFVAAILASYRGYDTLGETTVIFLAGLSVVLILKSISNREINAK